jgi:ankyrin repeat protein
MPPKAPNISATTNSEEPLPLSRTLKATSLACQEGWVKELKPILLQERYFNTIDKTDPSKRTALHHAAENGYLNEIPPEFLTIKNLLICDKDGKSVIETAAYHSQLNDLPAAMLKALDPDTLLSKAQNGKTLLGCFLEYKNRTSYKVDKYKTALNKISPAEKETKHRLIKALLLKLPAHQLIRINKIHNNPLLQQAIALKIIREDNNTIEVNPLL